jgi:hypothetical protein
MNTHSENLSAFLHRIWEDQRQRGHVASTREEVEERIREERDWGDSETIQTQVSEFTGIPVEVV